jgi:hypothetical protein
LKATRRERDPGAIARRVPVATSKDPALSALLALPLPVTTHSVIVPPPPPPVIVTLPQLEPELPTTPFAAPLPQSAETPLPVFKLPLNLGSVPPVSVPARAVPLESHARSFELSIVAVLSVLITLAFSFAAQLAAHWGEARATIVQSPRGEAAPEAAGASLAPSPAPASTRGAEIPVVPLRQLPVESNGAALRASAFATTGAGAGASRSELVRALAGVAQGARSCGSGPVQAQIVATFGPTGLPGNVHFGSGAPPPALRSCVLRAVSRARITPFSGPPVTVSKSLSW